jgi:hypothetical protein
MSAGNPDLPSDGHSVSHGSTTSGVRSTNFADNSPSTGAKIATKRLTMLSPTSRAAGDDGNLVF